MMQEAFAKLLHQDLVVEQQIQLLEQLSIDRLTAEDLAACAQLLLTQAQSIPLVDEHVVDLVGTGGDHSHSFNISTTSALVAAAAGCRVTKHGNKSITSKSGSFDLLQQLHISVPQNGERALQQLVTYGITFLFAPYFHPALKKVVAARKQLATKKIKTIFNVLGPLVNPMKVKRLALGVFRDDLVELYAEALVKRDTLRALVFCGDGMDELTLTAPSKVAFVSQGKIEYFSLDPQQYDLSICTLADLQGGDPEENAKITTHILIGEDRSPRRDIVLLNAAAALIVAEDGPLDFVSAIQKAAVAIDDGRAFALLQKLENLNVNPQ